MNGYQDPKAYFGTLDGSGRYPHVDFSWGIAKAKRYAFGTVVNILHAKCRLSYVEDRSWTPFVFYLVETG